MPTYRYTDASGTVVHVIHDDGKIYESMLASALPDGTPIQPWLADLAEWKAYLKARVAEKRWQVETGGTTVNGVPVVTDATSQAKLTGALNFVGRKHSRVIKWKAANGTFVLMTKPQIEALADGAGEFVALCFDAEAAHVAAIEALPSVAACQAYNLEAGWPA